MDYPSDSPSNSPVIAAVVFCAAVTAVLGVLAYMSHNSGPGSAAIIDPDNAIIYIIAASLVAVIGIPFAIAIALVARDGIEDDPTIER